MFDHPLRHRRRLRDLNFKPSPTRALASPPLLQRRFFFIIIRKHADVSWSCSKKKKPEIQLTDNSIDKISFGRRDLPAREVAASSVSSSPRALSTSMSVAAEVGLERCTICSVRAEESVGRGKHRKDTHQEATGTSILILGRVFRAFGGATLGCLATFSVGSGVDVRVLFCN